MPVVLLLVVLLLLAGGGVAIVASATERARLEGLLPHVREQLQALRLHLMDHFNLRTHVGQTVRTDAQQDAAVASGASSTSNSWHELRRAVDLYVYGPDGRLDLDGRHVELYRTMHSEAKKFGFRGLAFNEDGSRRYITTSKGKVWDGGHLEYPDGMTWAQAAEQAKRGVA